MVDSLTLSGYLLKDLTNVQFFINILSYLHQHQGIQMRKVMSSSIEMRFPETIYKWDMYEQVAGLTAKAASVNMKQYNDKFGYSIF